MHSPSWEMSAHCHSHTTQVVENTHTHINNCKRYKSRSFTHSRCCCVFRKRLYFFLFWYEKERNPGATVQTGRHSTQCRGRENIYHFEVGFGTIWRDCLSTSDFV
ncbi:hypothetical protein JOB18_046114 [Solea senegalensis]|uniref:Uncharacterized protein n=1 Tax=Solea senegalensis TaxID=28829 RepID=A0AAV6SWF0_SOLSE|nr:hypothetical protein JOB18_046114 [Solea senegalensis]